ncbi:pseudouridine synthase [Lasiosphaeria ovina]|uniref:tRNA pseudouridine synthase 1 n=1 Tax=Lasiosphaeria ovina TaxID=92902 RepID=A0AAE0N3R8_9PEZI|nr:pseudouridine synthase [Lasiosphaeria ovina]
MAADDSVPLPPAGAPAADTNTTTRPADESGRGGRGRGGYKGGYHGERRGGARGGRGGRGGGRGGRDRDNDKGGDDRNSSGFGSSKRDFPTNREKVQNNRSAKRLKVIEDDVQGNSYMSIPFTPEEIAAEERRPKRKVAVLIGYAGTGYHGIQINHKDKTVEGDVFAAFVAAGAISKANADDPKKSSLVRCARTDKGVHAAGNVLSLKLIVEDEDIVEKINKLLPDQIRIWAIQRTSNGFSCYQSCESRWYEYLMPSYALLPPQPHSFLGKKVVESAKEKGVLEEYFSRLDDVKDFWDEVEKNDIQPILDNLDVDTRAEVVRLLEETGEQELADEVVPTESNSKAKAKVQKDQVAAIPEVESTESAETSDAMGIDSEGVSTSKPVAEKEQEGEKELTPAELALREVKAAYITAKRRYRVTPRRLERLQQALDHYLGTHNFHNYTILKSFADPSAKRHIKSFKVDPTPICIGDTEWLSVKIHGQSFMMHQIRKMIALSVMLVRCGAPLDIINDSYGPRRISIPKAPGLGLMLERPEFTEYNKKAAGLGKEAIDFAKYEDQIQKFKDEYIYRRMFEVEEQENSFHLFFNQVDNFRTDYFLWATSGGVEASHERSDRKGGERVPKALQTELGDEADGVVEIGT